MAMKFGQFVIEVGVWEIYVKVPKVGEVYWNSEHGLTANRWADQSRS